MQITRLAPLTMDDRSPDAKTSKRVSHDEDQQETFFVRSFRITLVVTAYWCAYLFYCHISLRFIAIYILRYK